MPIGFETVVTIIKLVLTAIVVGLLGWTIYFVSNRKDPAKAPSDSWPEWYRNIVHVYPQEYAKTPTSNVIVSGTATDLFTAKKPADCANDKKKGCSKDEDCVGFVFNKPSSSLDPSTCTTYSSIDTVITDPRVSGNTAYFVDGTEPGTYYATFPSNTASTSVPTSKFPSYIATDYFECASKCASDILCTGFTFKSDSTCLQHHALKSVTDLAPDTNFTSYLLKSSLGYFASATL
jgi:hypothetical protein